jgi:hypothetical protein
VKIITALSAIKIFEYATELPFIGIDFHLEFYKNQQTGGSGNVT